MPEPPNTERARPRVLHVSAADDARAAVDAMSAAGLDATWASDAESVTAVVAATPPDLVVLDSALPRHVAEDVRRVLRAAPATAKVPVAHVSGPTTHDVHTVDVLRSIARLHQASEVAGEQRLPVDLHVVRAGASRASRPFSAEPLDADGLARRLSALHRGSLRVSRVAAGELEVELATSATAHPPHGKRVLLVDDHEDGLELFREVLEMEGHSVVTAQDGEDALALLFAGTFEVAILDIGLPGLTGLDVARLARERLGDAGPRLVAMTGYGGARDRSAAAAAGFHVHLVKPVKVDVLVDTVAAVQPRAAT